MDLSLTDEQRMLADSVRSVFKGADGDPTAGGHAPEGPLEFRRDLWRQGAELGLTALVTDESYDGAGAGIGEAYAAANALGELAAPEQLTDLAYLPAWLMEELGNEEQKSGWLPRMAAGDALVALAHAETGTGWSAPRTAAVSAGRLTGEKRAVAAPADLDAFLVTAVEDGTAGIFLVSAGEGVTVTAHRDAEWAATGTVNFDGAPAERLGDGGASGDAAEAALRSAVARARVVQCGRAVGLMETAVTSTVEYLKVRKQFGVTLDSFQALTHRASQMYSELELARSTALWAAAVAQNGDTSPGELESAALDAFVFLARQARVVAEEAVQLHGGIGVTYETAISHYAAALTGFQQIYGGVLEARGAGVASGSPDQAPSALMNNEQYSYS